MKAFNPTNVFELLLALIVSLVTRNPAATGSPTAAALGARATIALEKPQSSRVKFILVKVAKTYIAFLSSPITRVMCSRNSGIFVASYVSKLFFPPWAPTPPRGRPFSHLNSKMSLSFFCSFPRWLICKKNGRNVEYKI